MCTSFNLKPHLDQLAIKDYLETKVKVPKRNDTVSKIYTLPKEQQDAIKWKFVKTPKVKECFSPKRIVREKLVINS